jgi:hypothetical protein
MATTSDSIRESSRDLRAVTVLPFFEQARHQRQLPDGSHTAVTVLGL